MSGLGWPAIVGVALVVLGIDVLAGFIVELALRLFGYRK